LADTIIDLVGVIGADVLTHLLPERRLRTKTRMIKRSNSKYQARGPNIDRRSYQATTSIDIVIPDP
ncbi:transposase, partial [Actinoplanes sp. NPDC051475]